MQIKNSSSLIKYIKGFYEFEKYLNNINSNLFEKFEPHDGYLINLSKIEEIKKSINYDNHKYEYHNYESIPINNDSVKYYTIEEIKFRNSEYLLNMLFNGNKYILINTKLWKLLCKKNEENITSIKYEINYMKIKFRLSDQKELIFANQNNSNLITSEVFYTSYNSDYSLYKSRYENIVNNNYNKIIEYYKYQQNFKNSLKIPSKRSHNTGYLVDINWLTKWEKFNDYNNIKNNYLEKNIDKKKQIINHIIYIQQCNKLNGFYLKEPEVNKFTSKEELEAFLKRKKLVIIDVSILSFWQNLENKKIYYYLYDNKIEFYFAQNKEPLILPTKDNIITINNKINLEYPNLLQLIKIFYFRKFINREILNEHKMKNNNSIILIKNDIIIQYLSYFNYQNLSILLNQKDFEFEYKDLEQNFHSILESIKNLLHSYYEEIILKEAATISLNLTGQEYYLNPQPIRCKEKNFFYISDFEIIDDDIFSFFKENLMIQDKQVIHGKYIAEDGKIFLSYNYNDTNCFQISKFDITNENFIPELILEESFYMKNKMFEYFNIIGIKKLTDNPRNNIISTGVNIIGYFYNFPTLDTQQNEDIVMKDNQYDITEILSTLIKLNKFEQDIKDKLVLSKNKINDLKSSAISNPFSTIPCKLISETFMTEIKNLFCYQILKNIIDKYQTSFDSDIDKITLENILKKEETYMKLLLNKKNDFLGLKQRAYEFLKMEVISVYQKEIGRFQYPMKFNIIDDDLFKKFLNMLDLNGHNISKKPEEIYLTFNNGNLAFSGVNGNLIGNYKSLLYIYSLGIEQKSDYILYNPEAILEFSTDTDLFNKFPMILKEKILDKLAFQENYLTSQYECKICLNFNKNASNKDQQQINEFDLYDNDMENYYNQLLIFSVLFYLKYTNFYEQIKLFQNIGDGKMFLINIKYIDEIKLISQFNELDEAIKKNKEIVKNFDENDMNYLNKLKLSFGKDILIKFASIKKNDIKKKLDNPNLLDISPNHLYNDPSNNLFYYENIQIINKEIFEQLKKIDSHLRDKCVEATVSFSNNKAILWIDENGKSIINVGQINQLDEFEFEYLIQSECSFDLQKIFGEIKTKGYYNFQKKINKNDLIETKIDTISVKAKIYRLFSGKITNNFENNNLQNENYISEKLKALILLSISQNIDMKKSIENSQPKIETVYLMDSNYLLKYKYLDISSLINGNNEILNLVEEINKPYYPYAQKTLDEIISKLDQEQLKKINTDLQMIDLSNENWEARADKIELKGKKKISVYKEFVLIREKIFKEIKDKLSLSSTQKQINYVYRDGDIIIIQENYQYNIFFGNINSESHLFNLKYILDYSSFSNLKKELQFIIKYGIEQYKNEKTIFSETNKKDLISDIYDGRFNIGNFYIYSPGVNYGKLNEKDYSFDMNNEKLNKVLKLYNYYQKFQQKLNENYSSEEKYFLIKKDIMNDIKKDYNYDLVIQILKKAQYKLSECNLEKEKLYILKNFPEDIYDDFFNNKYPIEKRIKKYTSPESISITIPNSNNESVQIYDNFEILDSSIASEFIKDIYEKTYNSYNYGFYSYSYSTTNVNSEENYIQCTLKEGKAILYYPKDKFNNNKHIYALGSLDNDNTFRTEYLIIYRKEHGYFAEIKSKLNKYLQSIEQHLIYGPCPLTNDKFEEIGMVVGLKKISKSNIHKVDIDQNQIINQDETDFYPKPTDNGEYNEDIGIDQDIDPEPIDDRIIKQYNLDSQAPFSKIKECFSKPPLIGLENIGATCYMNATLQCLCNIPKFVNYFKFNKNLKDLVRNDITYGNNSMLCSSFKLLIEQLWPERLYFTSNTVAGLPSYGSIGSNNTYSNKKNESFAPKEFKKKISDMNDLFKGVAANDAKDLVNFLIMTLHKELNTAEKKNLITNAINQDQRNQQLMFNLFTQDFVNNNKSIISDLFYGVNYNIVQCNGCMARSFNYQTYFFFVFPLEEVRIFKSQNNYNNNFNFNMNCNNNEVNIYDCFLYDQKINYMMGENAMYCNFCKNQCNSQMCTLLAFGPEIIIIILNRGQGAQFKVKVNFTEQLNLYNFIDYKDTGVNYQLIGVITHLGGNDMSGHFIAYCKNPISNSWYQYNDSIVNEVNQANFQAEVIDYAMPYLLFYQKVGQ